MGTNLWMAEHADARNGRAHGQHGQEHHVHACSHNLARARENRSRWPETSAEPLLDHLAPPAPPELWCSSCRASRRPTSTARRASPSSSTWSMTTSTGTAPTEALLRRQACASCQDRRSRSTRSQRTHRVAARGGAPEARTCSGRPTASTPTAKPSHSSEGRCCAPRTRRCSASTRAEHLRGAHGACPRSIGRSGGPSPVGDLAGALRDSSHFHIAYSRRRLGAVTFIDEQHLHHAGVGDSRRSRHSPIGPWC